LKPFEAVELFMDRTVGESISPEEVYEIMI
jgi:hypothetical protein